MASKHTPGPWHVNNQGFKDLLKICDNEGFDICELFPYVGLYEEQEMKANANLISLSPEMYEVLIMAMSVIILHGSEDLVSKYKALLGIL